jgi:hypothetical protein
VLVLVGEFGYVKKAIPPGFRYILISSALYILIGETSGYGIVVSGSSRDGCNGNGLWISLVRPMRHGTNTSDTGTCNDNYTSPHFDHLIDKQPSF